MGNYLISNFTLLLYSKTACTLGCGSCVDYGLNLHSNNTECVTCDEELVGWFISIIIIIATIIIIYYHLHQKTLYHHDHPFIINHP